MTVTKKDLQNSLNQLREAHITMLAKVKEQAELISSLQAENQALKTQQVETEAINQKDLEDYLLVVNNLLLGFN